MLTSKKNAMDADIVTDFHALLDKISKRFNMDPKKKITKHKSG